MKVVSKALSALLIAGAIALAIFIGFAGFKANASNTPSTPTSPTTSIDLSGSWHQVPNDSTPTNMTAEISANHIQVMLYSSTVNGLYWDGTFNANNSSKIVSIADEKALSQDSTKTFHYENGVLSYDFTMLGKNYTVHLSRGE